MVTSMQFTQVALLVLQLMYSTKYQLMVVRHGQFLVITSMLWQETTGTLEATLWMQIHSMLATTIMEQVKIFMVHLYHQFLTPAHLLMQLFLMQQMSIIQQLTWYLSTRLMDTHSTLMQTETWFTRPQLMEEQAGMMSKF